MPSSDQILTQNGHPRSFKVIYFGIIEKTLRGYIAQDNNCGIECEGSEDKASEISENRHLRPPHSHLTPSLWQTPRNIHINLTLLETRFPALQFCRRQYIGNSSNFRTVLSKARNANSLVAEPETDLNAKWAFKVIQGHLFRCHWRATMGLHSVI